MLWSINETKQKTKNCSKNDGPQNCLGWKWWNPGAFHRGHYSYNVIIYWIIDYLKQVLRRLDTSHSPPPLPLSRARVALWALIVRTAWKAPYTRLKCLWVVQRFFYISQNLFRWASSSSCLRIAFSGPPNFRRLGAWHSFFNLRTSTKLWTPAAFSHFCVFLLPNSGTRSVAKLTSWPRCT